MKRAELFALVFCALTPACSSQYRAQYGFVLDRVAVSKSSTVAEGKISALNYADERLLAQWTVFPEKVSLELLNRTDQPFELVWDPTFYYNAEKLPKTIAPNTPTKLVLHPLAKTRSVPAMCFKTVSVQCSPAYIDHRGRYYMPRCAAGDLKTKACTWEVRVLDPLLPSIVGDEDELEKYLGSSFQFELPIKRSPYSFIFRVDRIDAKREPAGQELPPGLIGACPCKKRTRSDES